MSKNYLRKYIDSNGIIYYISDYPMVLNKYVENPFNCKTCNGEHRVQHDVFKCINGQLKFEGRICDKCLDDDYMEVIRNGKSK